MPEQDQQDRPIPAAQCPGRGRKKSTAASPRTSRKGVQQALLKVMEGTIANAATLCRALRRQYDRRKPQTTVVPPDFLGRLRQWPPSATVSAIFQ